MATEKLTTTANGMNVEWDDSKMESLYSNVATATANREEFSLLFGTHRNWRGTRPEEKGLEVDLTKRVILSPFAAKRLAAILNQSIKVYEDQFGKIES